MPRISPALMLNLKCVTAHRLLVIRNFERSKLKYLAHAMVNQPSVYVPPVHQRL